MWNCAAIDHGITIFPNGKIGPCCLITADYLKPISELTNPNRFSDLNTEFAPAACIACNSKEHQGVDSYRKMFNTLDDGSPGFQFVDIRNNNLCNLKCRYCGPHFSSQWAEELNITPAINSQNLTEYKDILITDSLHWMYFTGGEPLISNEHWALLEELINNGLASKISLLYNTNLTTIKYKDKNIINIWKQFKRVNVQCSIDATGEALEYIRSGCTWSKIQLNIEELQQAIVGSSINLILSPVLSILNIWFINDLYAYAKKHNILVNINLLTGPDYLAIDVIPDSLKLLALTQIDTLAKNYSIDKNLIQHIKNKINNNSNQCLFQHTLNHILLLDNLRGENLFKLLPFKKLAIDNILKNHEYE
jgi:sulfatase maturation enzyme AslB (radical SAM superfamily)